ncbi:hypothetical protein JCM8547_006719 [Rhodosporidiobolus lusitaniae]
MDLEPSAPTPSTGDLDMRIDYDEPLVPSKEPLAAGEGEAGEVRMLEDDGVSREGEGEMSVEEETVHHDEEPEQEEVMQDELHTALEEGAPLVVELPLASAVAEPASLPTVTGEAAATAAAYVDLSASPSVSTAPEDAASAAPLSTDELPSSVVPVEVVDAPLEEAIAAPDFPSVPIPAKVNPVPAQAGEETAVELVVGEVATDEGVIPGLDVTEEARQPVATSGEFANGARPVKPICKPAASSPPASHHSSADNSPWSRPSIDTSSLDSIAVSSIVPPSSTLLSKNPSAKGVPPVFLTYDESSYVLFHQHSLLSTSFSSAEDKQEGDIETETDEPFLLCGDEDLHDRLYYGPLSELFMTLREHVLEYLNEGEQEEEELVLEFDEIGIALGEDNHYASSVSIHDFDRIHLGCALPGRLHARLTTQGRFASGFNALVAHVAGASARDGEEDVEEEHEEGEEERETRQDGEEHDDALTVDGGEGGVEVEEGEEQEQEQGEEQEQEQGEEQEPHPRSDETIANDYDGPDSELVEQETQPAPDGGEGGQAEEEGDEFDLDSALAQLDGDDVVAVIEGAQEDFILSEVQREGADQDAQEQQREGGEEQQPQQESGVEEGQVYEEGEEKQEQNQVGGEGAEETAQPQEEEQVVGGELVAPSTIEEGEEQKEESVDTAVGAVEVEEAADSSFTVEQEQHDGVPAGEDGLAASIPVDEEEQVESATAATNGAELDQEQQDAVELAYDAQTESVDASAGATEGVASASDSAFEPEPDTEDSAPQEDPADALAFPSASNNEPSLSTSAIDPSAEAVDEPADVVIDYDEAFDASASAPSAGTAAAAVEAQPPTAPRATATNGVVAAVGDGVREEENGGGEGGVISPKRGRDEGEEAERGEVQAEEGAGAKRPRLADPAVEYGVDSTSA